MIELLNCDCMKYMRGQPDKSFDLAIVDPPYGIKRFQKGIGDGDRHKIKGDGGFNNATPTDEYFSELFRISDNQIIWGANNFNLPPTEYFCIWDKQQTVENFSSAEYAWVSEGTKKPAKVFRYSIHQNNVDRAKKTANIHPTQKPMRLYQWLLTNYAKPGQRILDTHLGSGSSAIAAHYFGVDFVGCEIDAHYYAAAQQRFDMETRQTALFCEGG